mgnify:CR=1 FL=1
MNILKNNYWKILIITLFLGVSGDPVSSFIYQSSIGSIQDTYGSAIKGTISNKSTGGHIFNASVTLGQSGKTVARTATLKDGSYIINDVLTGDYEMIVIKGGFQEGNDQVIVSSFEAIIIKDIGLVPVKIGENTKRLINSTGPQFGASKVISLVFGFANGAVFDNETGKGIARAAVSLKRSGLIIASGITSNDGAYFLRAPSGDYSIAVSKGGFEQGSDNIFIPPFERVTKDITLFASEGVTPEETPTPGPTLTPTPTPAPSPTPLPVPSLSPSPSPVPSPTPISECENGGVPSDIIVFPKTVILSSGERKAIKVSVLKEGMGGCSTEVMVNCTEGCDKIVLFDDSITTNMRGIARVGIKAENNATGLARISFSVGEIETEITVIINRRD